MQRFAGAQKRSEGVQEAPLMLHDIEGPPSVHSRRVHSDLTPLIEGT